LWLEIVLLSVRYSDNHLIDIQTINTFAFENSNQMKPKKGTILIVDDNEHILITLNQLLKKEFEKVITLKKPDQIRNLLSTEQFDVILLDMNFKAGVNIGNEGFFWLREIRKLVPDSIVLFITAYGDIDIAVKSMKEGANDFITKPWDSDKLISTIHSYVELSESKRKIERLQASQRIGNDLYTEIIGNSKAIQNTRNTISKIANTDATILILGENGSGKALIAYAIHKQSNRINEPFVHVDLGSLSEGLFESELFGHVKGAFTDAKEDRIGRFEAASDGTLFLDEIGNLSLALQQKLLSTLQTKTFTKVGSNKSISVDVRLICATNRYLKQMVIEGTFREDLYYRINTIQIESPPLRDREEDIVLLTKSFLKEFSQRYQKPSLQFTEQAFEKIMQYSWPGNVRELRHSVERAVLLANDKEIKPEDIFAQNTSQHDETNQSNKLEDVEKNTIIRVINSNKGNLTKASEELGISRSTLYLKIEKYGIQ
jgi:DNA-binding NtrC family response regulator